MAWNDNGDNGPWGRKKSSRPPGENNPDIDDILRQGQENIRRMMGGGKGGGFNRKIIYLIVLIGIGLWGSTGFYRVTEKERAVILRFGKAVRTAEAGLHYHLPSPIERALVVNVTTVNIVKSGGQTTTRSMKILGEDVQDLMLTGDENILRLVFTVQWFIKDVEAYLFNDPDPRETVKFAAESAVREVIAQTKLADALTKEKGKIIKDSKELLQKMLDEYNVGIEIAKVNLKEVDPPASVIDSFRDVQSARADLERKVNEATSYRNSIIPVARGRAEEIIKTAEAEKASLIKMSEGESQKFLSVLNEYRKAPVVTLTRLKIQNSEKVLSGMPKYIFTGEKTSQGVLPYLPIHKIQPSENKSN